MAKSNPIREISKDIRTLQEGYPDIKISIQKNGWLAPKSVVFEVSADVWRALHPKT